MKSLKWMLTTLVVFISLTVFAGRNFPVAREFEQSFRKNFPQQNISNWETEGNLTIAKFFDKGIKHRAYFDANASLLAVSKDLTTDLLPMTVLKNLEKNFGDFGKIRVLEFITAENDYFYLLDIYYKERVYTIKAYPYGGFDIIRKV